MATPDLEIKIPDEYKSQLRLVSPKDTRSDAEILHSLEQHVPITSEKNIWTYWHSGVANMPSWCQRNIINWVRLHDSSWTIRVLDTVPNSPNHALNWISPSNLPESFVKGTMIGPYVGPHSADFLRGAALHAYGGAWMDVGNILFRSLDTVCWSQLADPHSPFTVCTPWMYAQMTSNHFVAARKHDPFIQKWHELFIHFWKDKTDYQHIITSPLISFVKDFDLTEARARGFNWTFNVDFATILGYTAQCVAWIRLTWLQEPAEKGGFDGASYWANKILVFDVLEEDFAAEKLLGFRGEDLYKMFTMKQDGSNASSPEEFQRARETAWRLLSQSTMQKITHGKGLSPDTHCGVFLDRNEGSDGAEGTFGELLRYGSVCLEQTREGIRYVDAPRVAEDLIIRKGLLEP